MTTNEKIYQSILHKLSTMPVDYLKQVDDFLLKFSQEVEVKEQNKQKILSLAGTWQEMSDADFKEYMQETKRVGNEAFGRDIKL